MESARPAHFKAALAANDGSLIRRIRRLIDPAAHAPSRPGAAWVLSIVLLVAIGGVAMRAAQPASVARESIWLDTVRQGDITLNVRALGVLTSAHTAELHVAETQMKEVAAGQPVTIQFQNRKETVAGTLTQVRPGVTNGTVTVDMQLNEALPAGIAVQSPMDGSITIRRLSNVVYVGRPVFGKPNGQDTLFKVEPDGQHRASLRLSLRLSASDRSIARARGDFPLASEETIGTNLRDYWRKREPSGLYTAMRESGQQRSRLAANFPLSHFDQAGFAGKTIIDIRVWIDHIGPDPHGTQNIP